MTLYMKASVLPHGSMDHKLKETLIGNERIYTGDWICAR